MVYVIGQTEQHQWGSINWRHHKLVVRNLRGRIFRAASYGQNGKVRSLTKLLMRSYSNLLTSIRQITQINTGKQTAGVDGQTAQSSEERMALSQELRDGNWQLQPTKRVFIPKKNSKQRPLGIPTVYSHCTSFNKVWG